MGWVSRTSSPRRIPFLYWVRPNHWPRSNYISWYSSLILKLTSVLLKLHLIKKPRRIVSHQALLLVWKDWCAYLLKSESWAFRVLTSPRVVLGIGRLGLRSRRSEDGAEGSLVVWKHSKQKTQFRKNCIKQFIMAFSPETSLWKKEDLILEVSWERILHSIGNTRSNPISKLTRLPCLIRESSYELLSITQWVIKANTLHYKCMTKFTTNKKIKNKLKKKEKKRISLIREVRNVETKENSQRRLNN